jgi:hypothetical protein
MQSSFYYNCSRHGIKNAIQLAKYRKMISKKELVIKENRKMNKIFFFWKWKCLLIVEYQDYNIAKSIQ